MDVKTFVADYAGSDGSSPGAEDDNKVLIIWGAEPAFWGGCSGAEGSAPQ